MAIKRVYRSMQGKVVDMDLLAQKHELAPAIGNAKMNARGDELGPGGKIIRKREDIMADYYNSNPSAVRDEQYVRPTTNTPVAASASVVESAKKTVIKKEVKNDIKEDPTDS